MQIYGPSQLHGAQSISGPHNARPAQSTSSASAAPVGDSLDISDAGQLAGRLADVPEIRTDRVQQIRADILNGTYETSDKLGTALDRLLDEIG
jgi:negative regulator of flagellin synthesis FlgM